MSFLEESPPTNDISEENTKGTSIYREVRSNLLKTTEFEIYPNVIGFGKNYLSINTNLLKFVKRINRKLN